MQTLLGKYIQVINEPQKLFSFFKIEAIYLMPKMSNKLIRFFATIICSLISFLAHAGQFDTQISADSITVEKGEVLNAEGTCIFSMEQPK